MLVALVLSGGAQAQTSSGKSTYLDPHQAIHRRVDDLLKRMTKKGGASLICPASTGEQLGKTIPERLAP